MQYVRHYMRCWRYVDLDPDFVEIIFQQLRDL